jgi:hypothetical protein
MNAKNGTDTTDREMTNLPDLPKLVALKPQDQAMLDDWWRKTREVLRRFEDRVNDGLKTSGSP